MVEFSPVAGSRDIKMGDIMTFTAHSIDLSRLGEMASPLASLDHYRLKGRPFAPHVHAGFSAVAYVLDDSPCAMRSRDTLGNDMRTEPGGVLWTQAASGIIHEDTTFDLDKEMHGVQLFVNLKAEHKKLAPSLLPLAPEDVPVWRNDAGDTIRVLCGSFAGLEAPLHPAAAFTFLDVALRDRVDYDLPAGLNLIVFVLEGQVQVSAGGVSHTVHAAEAIAASGGPATVSVKADVESRVLLLSAAPIHEPFVRLGNGYIMNDQAGIDDAVSRYEGGLMGRLSPRED